MSISLRTKHKALPKGFWRNPIHLISSGFGTGASRYAPGTVGTLIGVMLYLCCAQLSLQFYILVVIFAFVLGVFACGYSSRAWGTHDHNGIVWDEVTGYLLAMTALPFDWRLIVTGFFVFRFFDVIKPWPIRQADRHVKGGFGIMLDDVLAAVYTWIVLKIGVIIFLQPGT